MEWNALLRDQLDFHWRHQLRPRLEGLTDEEYLWEPVPDCWSIRRRSAKGSGPKGSGPKGSGPKGSGPNGGGDANGGEDGLVIDWEYPAPEPAPVTTIAWRLGHLIVGVLGMRVAGHFGGEPMSYGTFPWAATASSALDQLDGAYRKWHEGVGTRSERDLLEACGPAEGAWGDQPMAVLILHINREVIHHGAEIALLRDLYRRSVAR
ncbi:DinB family protein [Actinoplanes sp. NPDC051851]|uniref:DinB family protein n=1 Tax=Actinoplanes sp. NPDC051851 TaxID=3154753 RepID=UPI003448BF33